MYWLCIPASVLLGIGLYLLFWKIFFRVRVARMKRWVKAQDE
ncbi:MAG: hypothetical protein ACYC96_16535 [Fimbriimonadaceae bacterium]